MLEESYKVATTMLSAYIHERTDGIWLSSDVWCSCLFMKRGSFVFLYQNMQLALYSSIVIPPFPFIWGYVGTTGQVGRLIFGQLFAISAGDYFLAIIQRLLPTHQQ